MLPLISEANRQRPSSFSTSFFYVFPFCSISAGAIQCLSVDTSETSPCLGYPGIAVERLVISCGHLTALPAKKEAFTMGLARSPGISESSPALCPHTAGSAAPCPGLDLLGCHAAGQHADPCKQTPAHAHLPALGSGKRTTKGRGSPGFPCPAIPGPSHPVISWLLSDTSWAARMASWLFRMVPVGRVGCPWHRAAL